MAKLPDPSERLTGEDRAAFDHAAEVRGEGRPLAVYVALFNNPPIAAAVGELGAKLRFDGELADDVRELVILRLAERLRVAYEWAHHVGIAREAGISEQAITALEAGSLPEGLRAEQDAALRATDAVLDLHSIPADAQAELGDRAAVEVAALVGAYRSMAGVIAGFEVEIEPELERPDW